MKTVALALALMTNVSIADTGSLWCAFSSYGTPTETIKNGATALALIQLDSLTGDSVQIYLEDIYHGKTDVFVADLKQSNKQSIAGVKLGSYSGQKNLVIKTEKGKILLNLDDRTFNCEIPGEYKEDYSRDIKR